MKNDVEKNAEVKTEAKAEVKKKIQGIFNTKNIAAKLRLYFIFFAVIIFAILWCMQVLFLQSYYSIMKKTAIIHLANEMESNYVEENMDELFNNVSYKNDISVFLINIRNNIMLYKTNKPMMNEVRAINVNMLPVDEITNKMLDNPKGNLSYTIMLKQFKSEIYIYASMINGTDYCLIVASQIDPIASTISVLKNQLIYITIIALILSVIISIVISKKIAKPMVKMNQNVKKLAKGQYDIVFEKAGYEEMDNLADTLNNVTQELEKTDTLRKELIANVSHDLKTPLTMIKAYSEMIKDLYADDKEKREESLNIIIEETDRLNKLVVDMLDLSKLEQNKVELALEEFNIYEVIEKIVSTIRNMKETQEYNISVEGIEKDNVIANVLADRTKIEQVIYNLLWNAIKYVGEDKNIVIKIVESEKGQVRVSVIDHGIGIPKEELPYIWNRYYKCNREYVRSKEGTGLGLAIVKNILELHNAEYGVISEEGKGSIFWFELNCRS